MEVSKRKSSPKSFPKFEPVSNEYKGAQRRIEAIELCYGLEKHIPFNELGPPDENHPNRKEWEEANSTFKNEIWARLKVLFDHYNIEAGDYLLLALLLANDLVPNFNVFPRRPGRRKGRKVPIDIEFCFRVKALASIRMKGIPDACRSLAERDGPWKGANPDTLEVRYYEEMRRCIPLSNKPIAKIVEEEVAKLLAKSATENASPIP